MKENRGWRQSAVDVAAGSTTRKTGCYSSWLLRALNASQIGIDAGTFSQYQPSISYPNNWAIIRHFYHPPGRRRKWVSGSEKKRKCWCRIENHLCVSMLALFTFHRLIPSAHWHPTAARPFLYFGYFGFFLNAEIWQEEEKGNDNKSSSSSE